MLLLLHGFWLGHMVSVRESQHLLCSLIAASSLVHLGLLFLRPLQCWFNAHKLDPQRHSRRSVFAVSVARYAGVWQPAAAGITHGLSITSTFWSSGQCA